MTTHRHDPEPHREPHREPDHVGRILEQWARERPDLDVSPMAVIGRVHRVGEALHARLRPVFAAAGLSDGDFDVLAALRRAGRPYELGPGALASSTMVTSGAVTKRVDRLERAGLVRRRVADEDARARVVALSPSGVDLVDRVLEQHVANEHRLVAALTSQERDTLAGLLARWGQALEGP